MGSTVTCQRCDAWGRGDPCRRCKPILACEAVADLALWLEHLAQRDAALAAARSRQQRKRITREWSQPPRRKIDRRIGLGTLRKRLLGSSLLAGKAVSHA